ncbi:hypothetical protein [Rhodococcus sp. JS3073]|uniref:hypothetical protein n=1 Tax=Rhodococcus sp. JS3073 TaxID=3002901 RepID=UPI002286722C|nr:hypothetical protein [Rhodococcus sp. JS3073]WAM14940.1 hypothetical protein OYT95_37225 [Rhodococcus sp. JS3073]
MTYVKSRKRDRADDAVSAVREVAVEHRWAVFDLVGETTSRFGGPTVVSAMSRAQSTIVFTFAARDQLYLP